jgi:LmbE family N-acetylglucosaminyl deacetylase
VRSGAVDRLLDALAAGWARSWARDVTDTTGGRSCLVLAPHQDDETLGCGVLLCRKAQAGAIARVLFASDGRHSHRSPMLTPTELARRRRAEASEACRRLGVGADHLHFLELEEGRLWEELASLRAGIAAVYRVLPTDEVYMPSIHDEHPDHRAVARAAIDLARAGVIRAPLYEYPIWTARPAWRAWLRRQLRLLGARLRGRGPVQLRLRLVRTDGFLERKRHALDAHETQMRRLGGDAEWLTLADVDGGRFLAGFFGRHERFCRHHPGIDEAPAR